MVGLIALVASGVGDASDGGPVLWHAIAITAIVVAGGTLAYARVSFEWAATLIKRRIDDGEVQDTDALAKLPEDEQGWPKRPEAAWTVGRWAILVAAAAFLVSVWWSTIVALFC